MVHRIIHVQLQVPSIADATQFYSNVFGWTIKKIPELPGFANWYVSSHSNEAMGSFQENSDDKPSTGTVSLFINTDNIEATLRKIEEFGGSILQQKQQIAANFGYSAQFLDPFGNQMVLWSPEEGAI